MNKRKRKKRDKVSCEILRKKNKELVEENKLLLDEIARYTQKERIMLDCIENYQLEKEAIVSLMERCYKDIKETESALLKFKDLPWWKKVFWNWL
jgi:agmatine/peptidylarginine deiminase